MYYFIEYYKYKWIQSRGRMVNKLDLFYKFYLVQKTII